MSIIVIDGTEYVPAEEESAPPKKGGGATHQKEGYQA